MSPSRENAGSILGKRSHRSSQVDANDAASTCGLDGSVGIPTPDSTPNPKRAKTTVTMLDGDNNKENIPPFILQAINASPSSHRLTRSLRRTSTIVQDISSRPSTPRRYASTSNLRQVAGVTPATSLANLSLATPPPTPPSVLLPLHVRARALLRPTCNDGPQMAGRQHENSVITAFILSFIGEQCSDGPSALFISGSPGTGKTALVHSILTALAGQIGAKDAQVLTINCMALDGVDAVWQRLAETLGNGSELRGRGRKSKNTPQQLVAKTLGSSERKCILILDELDHVASSTQSLSPLFTLAHKFSGGLRLIGIANTHTLTSSSATTASVQSLAGVQTLHFAPYTAEQLLGILQARLAPLLTESEDVRVAERVKKFLPLPTLTLLSKKIAAQTGDVRAVFEVLRGAVDLAVTTVSAPDPLNTPAPTVTPSHILAALKAYSPAGKTSPAIPATSMAPVPYRRTSDSETVAKVRELGLQQRLVLLASLLAIKSTEAGVSVSGSSPGASPGSPIKRTQSSCTARSKTIAFEMGQLHSFYSTILSRSENGIFAPVSRSEFGDLVGVLEVVGLLTISTCGSLSSTPGKSGKKTFSRSSSFAASSSGTQKVQYVDGVRLDEITRGLGLGSDDTPVDLREEEVRAIFQREQARIERMAKSCGKNGHADAVGFEDATED